MKKLLLIAGLLSACLAHGTTTAYSPPVGGVTSSAIASSDTFLSTTLSRPPEWIGTIASVVGSNLTVSGSPNWTINHFSSSAVYYARMLSGAQRGHYFIITGNTIDTLTVNNAGLDLSTVVNGDSFEVTPFWTLGTLYPASQAGVSFTATTSLISKKTQILLFSASSTGINRSANFVYYFYNGAWRQTGQLTTTSFDSTIIPPDACFIQRNSTSPTTLVYTGRVQPGYLGSILEATSGAANDNFVALAFPVDVTLNSSGLASSSFVTTTSLISTKDQLLWFDPAGTGTNRSANFVYYYYNGAWRQKGALTSTDFGATVLKAGSGFVIRKASTSPTVSWVYTTGI